jgi:Lipocalin-like domain
LQTLRERLIGTWRLVSYHVSGADGAVVYPMGRQVDGLIMYLPDGHMSANLMVPGRAAYSGGTAASATPAELAAAAAGYFGYAGRFEVDEAAGVVSHRIEVALMPNLAGSVQRRNILLEGRRLTLRGDATPEGSTPYIIWERVA